MGEKTLKHVENTLIHNPPSSKIKINILNSTYPQKDEREHHTDNQQYSDDGPNNDGCLVGYGCFSSWDEKAEEEGEEGEGPCG